MRIDLVRHTVWLINVDLLTTPVSKCVEGCCLQALEFVELAAVVAELVVAAVY